jgi:hypothetical protein
MPTMSANMRVVSGNRSAIGFVEKTSGLLRESYGSSSRKFLSLCFAFTNEDFMLISRSTCSSASFRIQSRTMDEKKRRNNGVSLESDYHDLVLSSRNVLDVHEEDHSICHTGA